MRLRRLALAPAVALACAIWPGCAGGDALVVPPVVVAMTADTPAFYDDGQTQIFQVNVPFELPVRGPTGEEAAELGEAAPYPRAPFLDARRTRVTLRYSLTNLDDVPRTVELLVDPWNEFVRYVPGVTAVREDEIVPNPSGVDRWYVLPPRSRVEGLVTEDDVVELAMDLGTALALEANPAPADGDFGGAVLYNRAMEAQNRSYAEPPDPLLRSYFPSVAAGLVGFDLGLRSEQAGNVALEVVVDVLDLDGDRVVREGDEATPFGRPGRDLTPPAAAP